MRISAESIACIRQAPVYILKMCAAKRFIVLLPLLLSVAAPAADYPLKASADGRYLVDQDSTPFLMVGDSPHSLIVNLSDADAAAYILNRATNGFNALLAQLYCVSYTGGRSDGSMLDGTVPFTGTISGGYYDLTKPNEAYFAHVDFIVNTAANNGIVMVLDPFDAGGGYAAATANGASACRFYGQFLGNRYKNNPNIIWSSGNDYDISMWSDLATDSAMTSIALGIRDNDPNHLQTCEFGGLTIQFDSLCDTNWWPIMGLNAVYVYGPTYAGDLYAYGRTNFIPIFNTEGHYEYEGNGYPSSNSEEGTALVLRKQEYWNLLSGCSGQLYGNHYTWTFASGWQSYLNSAGVAQLQHVTALFQPRQWWKLVPDTNHVVLTAGYGYYESDNTGLISTNDYVTCAASADGTLAMAYDPAGYTLTVDLSKFSGSVTSRWYDPVAGTFTAISGSPFANSGNRSFATPGNNSGGNADWVLVLEAGIDALQIVTGSLPPATTGAAYSSQIMAMGGSPPYTWSLAASSAPLPPGFSFSTGGVLSGVATSSGVFTMVVQVEDSTDALATQGLTISITASDTTAPSVPAGLAATAANSSQINLSWVASTDNVGVAGYLVERSQGLGSTAFVQVGAVSATNFADTGLSAATVYNYRVRATDAAGNLSGYSSVASATTPANGGSPTPDVAWYRFREGSGTIFADSTTNANRGSLIGTPAWTTLNGVNAISLNGTTQYGKAADIAANRLSGSWTVSCWICPTAFPSREGYSMIVEKVDSGDAANYAIVMVNYSGTTSIQPYYDNGTTAPSDFPTYSLSLNTAYNVVAVWDSTVKRCSLYINGSLIGTSGTETILPKAGSGGQFDIGTDKTPNGSASAFFAGKIEDVRVFRSALSGAQISAIYSWAPDTTAPTAPTGVVASGVSTNQVNVSWMASTDDVGVTGYRVERSQGSGSTIFTQVGAPTGTNYSDSGLLAGTVYNYRVRATDAAGNLSGYSTVVSAATLALPDTMAPTAPTGVVASGVSTNQVNVSWMASTDNVGVTGYLVERSQGSGSTTFTPGGRADRNQLQRQRVVGGDGLQLSGAGDGCGGQSERVFYSSERNDAGPTGHDGADGADGGGGEWSKHEPSEGELDGIDGQRGGDGVSGGAESGVGFNDFHAGGRPDGNQLQRQRVVGGDGLQLSGAGDGCGGQSERVFYSSERNDAGPTGHDGADGADGGGGEWSKHEPSERELDGFVGRRGGDGVSGGAESGVGFNDFHPGGRADRNQLQRQRVVGGDGLQLSGAGDGCGGQSERVFYSGERNDAGPTGHDGADGADGFGGHSGEQ